ncbi:MAG: cytochrome c-type biogenesis protein CcmH [Nitrospinae bacterium]|nr:cytochrome c-type biogenesis protein CcmH [Nitrospinota bacterium]
MKQLVMLLLILALSASVRAAEQIPVGAADKDALYESLISDMACLCGCGTTLKTCPHENCDKAIPARKEICQMVDSGTPRQEIINQMVKSRGEAILAAPTFKGFNVMAWVTPFVAIVAVGMLVAMILKRWSGNRAAVSPDASPKKTAESGEGDPYLKKMRDELDKYEE